MQCEGTVVSVEGNKARVRVATTPECTGCSSRSHCHMGSETSRDITVINEYGAAVSDRVILESGAGGVLFSSVLIWIVPLLSMFAGYGIGTRFGSGIVPIAGAFLFLVLAFGLLKVLDNTLAGGKTFYPRITHIIR